MQKVKLLLTIVLLLAIGVACRSQNVSNNSNSVLENNSSTDSPVPTPTATPTPTNAPLPEEGLSDPDELPPLSFEEILEAGVETGDWTMEEGIVSFLQYFVGEKGTDDLPGVDEVIVQSGSEIVALADEILAQPDANPQTQSEIERLLRILHPPQVVLDEISQPEGETGATTSAKLAYLGQPVPLAQTEEEDCINLAQGGYDPEEIEGRICLLYRERVVTTRTTIRVYFPIWTEDSEEIFTTINTLLNTLEETTITYNRLNGIVLKDYNIIFWPREFFNIPISTRIEDNTDACMLNFAWIADLPESAKQNIARQMFTCVLNWTYGNANKWWGVGSSLYFSNVAYPQGDYEWEIIPYFDRYSVNLPIDRMGHANFVFFQFLGNVYNPQTVIDIIGEIDSGTLFDWFHYIAPGSPGDFTRFVVDYLSEGIADENTGSYFISPSPPRVTGTITVDEVGDYTLESEALNARRYFVDYKEEKRFLQVERDVETSAITGVEAKLHQNRSAWSSLPPEIRSSCEEDVRYLFVPTFRLLADHRFNQNTIQVTEAEQAVCDPCLLGAWRIDNLSFSEYMEGVFEENVPQVSNFVTYIGGDYFMQFDSEGNIQTQRIDLSVYYGLESGIPIQPTLNPDAPGPQPTEMVSVPVNGTVVINSSGIGKYSADGEIMKVTQFVDVVDDATAGIGAYSSGFFIAMGGINSENMPGGVASESPNESAPYTCEGDILEITMPYYESILRLDRVDHILPTPVPTLSPQDNQ